MSSHNIPRGLTVEKIGGTSMSRSQEVLDNVLLGNRTDLEIYNRIFVVSAYGGITNLLLENKKTGAPGVYAKFVDAQSREKWQDALLDVQQHMLSINADVLGESASLKLADQFVLDRIASVRTCLNDLQHICSFGQFDLAENLMNVREVLSGIGEAHSAHNTALLLKECGVNAAFIDLTGWRDASSPTLDQRLQDGLADVDLSRTLPIITGYAHCREGLVRSYNRGYSEVTLSRLACMFRAREAIIHKEFHLSSADPNIVGTHAAAPIGKTNYDVADQLSNMGMEAIHPQAAQGLRKSDIPLRIKNTFEPSHVGTTIQNGYERAKPGAEIITGRAAIYALEVFEPDMVGAPRYDIQILQAIDRHAVQVISKDVNANSITHYIDGSLKITKRLVQEIQRALPGAETSIRKVAMVAVIASDLSDTQLIARAVRALDEAGTPMLALQHSSRRKDVRFVVKTEDYETAIRALHQTLVEDVKGTPSTIAAE